DRHRSVRLVILVGLAIDQIAQSGLSSLSVIYYSAQLFSQNYLKLSLRIHPYQKLSSEFIHSPRQPIPHQSNNPTT
ncbi:hypothetical protein, partial [Citrobacter sp. EC_71]|uniref:hypothetical protein n=1 Tax=Citrobacter sp. EC_71 TaxID=2584093 RepID=UPI001C705B91